MIDTNRFNARCAVLLANGYVLRSNTHGTYAFVHFWNSKHFDAIGHTDLIFMSSREWLDLLRQRKWVAMTTQAD